MVSPMQKFFIVIPTLYNLIILTLVSVLSTSVLGLCSTESSELKKRGAGSICIKKINI